MNYKKDSSHVIDTGGGGKQTQRDNSMLQALKMRVYKPQNCQQPPEAGKDNDQTLTPGPASFQKSLALPAPRFQHFQNHKRINFYCVKLLSLWSSVTPAAKATADCSFYPESPLWYSRTFKDIRGTRIIRDEQKHLGKLDGEAQPSNLST